MIKTFKEVIEEIELSTDLGDLMFIQGYMYKNVSKYTLADNYKIILQIQWAKKRIKKHVYVTHKMNKNK